VVQLVGGIAAAASLGDRPSYTEDPNFARSAGRAETMAQMGYTPQERASFQGDLASAQATDYQRGMDVSWWQYGSSFTWHEYFESNGSFE